MIKKITALVIIFSYIVFLPFIQMANLKADDSEQETTFVFPAALKILEDEAFVDTAAKTLVFPDGFLYMGDRAFADSKSIRTIVFPSSIAYIADSAFSEYDDIIVCSAEGSYAQNWAEKNGAAFISGDIWGYLASSRKTANHYVMQAQRLFHVFVGLAFVNTVKEGQDRKKSRRPQDRPELNPIDYRFP